MQSEELNFAFEQIKDDASVDLNNIFLENHHQESIQKPKDQLSTKPGCYQEDQNINQWENYFTNKEIKPNFCLAKLCLIESQKKFTEGLYKLEKVRQKRFIDVSDFKKKQYLRTVKGTKEQTSELNINLKTLTKSMLKQETIFMKISKEENQAIQKFQSSSANFKVFRKLFGVNQESQQDEQKQEIKNGKKNLIVKKKFDRIRKMCFKKFSSSYIVQQVHKGKMNQFNKLILMKFLEPIRMSCVYPQNFTNWKSKINNKKCQ